MTKPERYQRLAEDWGRCALLHLAEAQIAKTRGDAELHLRGVKVATQLGAHFAALVLDRQEAAAC